MEAIAAGSLQKSLNISLETLCFPSSPEFHIYFLCSSKGTEDEQRLPQLSHTGRDLSHHVPAKLAEIQKAIPKPSPPAFLFPPSSVLCRAWSFQAPPVTRCVKGKLAAPQPIVTAPYETQGFQLHFLPADLIEALHASGISSCTCRVQNTKGSRQLPPRCLQPLAGVHCLCGGILMKVNCSQHS